MIDLNYFILYLLKSSTIIGNYCRRVGLIPPLPRTSSPTVSSERNDENCYCKLLSSKRQLFLKMHNLASRLRRVTPDKIWDLATQFREVEILFTYFKTRANSDSKTKGELLEEVDARFECCHKLHENLMRNGLGGDTEIGNSNVELSAKDSTSQSQLTKCSSKLSTVCKKLLRRIELKRQRAEISATHKRDPAKAKVAAEAADAEARFRFEEARLEAEEKLLELSVSGLSISSSRAYHSNYRDTTESKSVVRRDNFNVKKFWSRGREEAVAVRIPRSQQVTLNAAAASSNSVFKKYLERQGRNEFINLAAQIGYDERIIAFMFYKKQIRKLMSESTCDERKLEALKASCSGQPREMVNLFLAPMKNMSTSQRIEKAIDRLHQRYGVFGGLTTKPQIIAIRNDPKVISNSVSLKSFNED